MCKHEMVKVVFICLITFIVLRGYGLVITKFPPLPRFLNTKINERGYVPFYVYDLLNRTSFRLLFETLENISMPIYLSVFAHVFNRNIYLLLLKYEIKK